MRSPARLALALRLGFRMSEVGIVWVNREASKLSIRRTLVPAVKELLAARRNVRGHRAGHGAVLPPPAAESPEPGLDRSG